MRTAAAVAGAIAAALGVRRVHELERRRELDGEQLERHLPGDLPAACPAAPPSYSKDVAAVVEQSCTPCHAPGGKEASRPL